VFYVYVYECVCGMCIILQGGSPSNENHPPFKCSECIVTCDLLCGMCILRHVCQSAYYLKYV